MPSQTFSGPTAALTVLLSLMSSSSAAGQTRVSLAEGRASVVFPVGKPLQTEFSQSDIRQLRELEAQGHVIDRSADFYEVRDHGEWFVASATQLEGSGVEPPACPKAQPAEGLNFVQNWSCRELRRPGLGGIEVRYTNVAGEALRIRSHERDGKLYMLIHARDAGDPELTGDRSQADAFFASFQVATPRGLTSP